MAELNPLFTYGTDAIVLCPHCETHGGYVKRLPRPWWRRILFLRARHYHCQECEKHFYLPENKDGYIED
ncbi:hypothetical protein [Thiolinea disciformis]|uniref:hypothetical protein n=1 Tax=Thiolinea disciformis TaxID=125614 RepID=UPI00036C27B0|nr:hypothetical protein [Thiolinea disciformis]